MPRFQRSRFTLRYQTQTIPITTCVPISYECLFLLREIAQSVDVSRPCFTKVSPPPPRTHTRPIHPPGLHTFLSPLMARTHQHHMIKPSPATPLDVTPPRPINLLPYTHHPLGLRSHLSVPRSSPRRHIQPVLKTPPARRSGHPPVPRDHSAGPPRQLRREARGLLGRKPTEVLLGGGLAVCLPRQELSEAYGVLFGVSMGSGCRRRVKRGGGVVGCFRAWRREGVRWCS